jgi:ATP-binding cassette subfamily C protein
MAQPELSMSAVKARGLLRAAFLFSVFSNLLMLTGPLFMLQVYDRVLSSRSEETLVALFGLVAVLYLLYGLLEYARGRVMAWVGARFQSEIAPRLFRAALDATAAGRPGGREIMSDAETVRGAIASPIVLAAFDLPWTVVFVAAIFLFHPLMGWLAMAGGGLLIAVTLLNQILTARRTDAAQTLSARAAALQMQTLDGAETAVAQGLAPALSDRWERLSNARLGEMLQADAWTGGFSAFTRALRFFLQSAMLALGAWLVLGGQITAGAMIAASILLGRALAPVEMAISQWPLLQRARGSWRRLVAFLAETPAPAAPTPLPVPEAELTVRNVSVLRAPGEPPILAQVGFAVPAGHAMGIIGRSGSGKTTLARVLAGLVPPNAGEVRLGGATLGQYGADRLGQLIGYLPQDVRFFPGTIAENIAHMSPKPDAAQVVAAARNAHVHDVVLALPKGYDTPIGTGGAGLSGGQRQRLALARALYGDPVLLILDEPNSALDAEGSEALNAAIRAMKEDGRAVVLMTHRPTAISACDTLLILDKGRVAALGPRDEIIRSMLKNAADVERAVGAGQAQ